MIDVSRRGWTHLLATDHETDSKRERRRVSTQSSSVSVMKAFAMLACDDLHLLLVENNPIERVSRLERPSDSPYFSRIRSKNELFLARSSRMRKHDDAREHQRRITREGWPRCTTPISPTSTQMRGLCGDCARNVRDGRLCAETSARRLRRRRSAEFDVRPPGFVSRSYMGDF